MPVVVGDGILIGQLGEVYSTSARVTLLTHPESVINIVDEATGAQGVLRGAYGLGMTLDLIPQSDTLHTGDRVITSGLGGTLPRALVIGTIEDIHPTPDRLFQQASIKPAVSLDAARFVQIIRTFTPFQAQ
jgi:rod shape-determining protein MreC